MRCAISFHNERLGLNLSVAFLRQVFSKTAIISCRTMSPTRLTCPANMTPVLAVEETIVSACVQTWRLSPDYAATQRASTLNGGRKSSVVSCGLMQRRARLSFIIISNEHIILHSLPSLCSWIIRFIDLFFIYYRLQRSNVLSENAIRLVQRCVLKLVKTSVTMRWLRVTVNTVLRPANVQLVLWI